MSYRRSRLVYCDFVISDKFIGVILVQMLQPNFN